MKNLKNLAFGLLVAVLAISTQAFKNSETEPTAKFVNHYYGWNGTEYQLIGTTYDSERCISGDELCVKILDTDTPPATISQQDAENLPSPMNTPEDSQYRFD
ncbi:hypothetical protein [Pedobacter xixiisoli]|uniref:Uncharacterized protein n=1 Tax=Pedobacter xixiisoli TaxID=1476464 RepID=A0A285ZW92_9SPHI|nr:hypothetical protein [Pedobacter xixiisoli]SOD13912.1 hypothetical protein SAMN06297358_1305 [Pedobacter xixiisoli]